MDDKKYTRENTSKKRYVESCVSAISFPNTIDELNCMIKDKGMTDIQLIQKTSFEKRMVSWSVAKWILPGDVIFFYMTKNSLKKCTRLLDRIKKNNKEIISILSGSINLIKQYNGSIFATGLANSSATYDYYEGAHFKSNNFSQIHKINILKNVIKYETLTSILKLYPQSTITPLGSNQFKLLRNIILRKNKNESLEKAVPCRDIKSTKIDTQNWLEILRDPAIRYRDESQVRSCFIDTLLNQMKDPDTQVYKECQCYSKSKLMGIVDYMMHIYGNWIPVEAKLNLNSEQNFYKQFKKYIKIEGFKPLVGSKRGKYFKCKTNDLLLIIDQQGIYFFKKDTFVFSDKGNPFLERNKLNESRIQKIKYKIKDITKFECK